MPAFLFVKQVICQFKIHRKRIRPTKITAFDYLETVYASLNPNQIKCTNIVNIYIGMDSFPFHKSTLAKRVLFSSISGYGKFRNWQETETVTMLSIPD